MDKIKTLKIKVTITLKFKALKSPKLTQLKTIIECNLVLQIITTEKHILAL